MGACLTSPQLGFKLAALPSSTTLMRCFFFFCFFYHGAIEVTRCFVPGLRVSIFTHTYVVHQSVAVDKTFA